MEPVRFDDYYSFIQEPTQSWALWLYGASAGLIMICCLALYWYYRRSKHGAAQRDKLSLLYELICTEQDGALWYRYALEWLRESYKKKHGFECQSYDTELIEAAQAPFLKEVVERATLVKFGNGLFTQEQLEHDRSLFVQYIKTHFANNASSGH